MKESNRFKVVKLRKSLNHFYLPPLDYRYPIHLFHTHIDQLEVWQKSLLLPLLLLPLLLPHHLQNYLKQIQSQHRMETRIQRWRMGLVSYTLSYLQSKECSLISFTYPVLPSPPDSKEDSKDELPEGATEVLYINNLNERIKLDSTSHSLPLFSLFACSPLPSPIK